ncbi:MAG: undecaprenyl-diphosphate phosphatase [Elusimicrobiales bacterium]
MGMINSIILGILQGLGEFLPISSSAHLYLYSYLTNMSYQGLSFDVMLHMGTLLAIFSYFFKDIKNIVKNSIQNPKGEDSKFLFYIAIATVPGVIAGLTLDEIAENVFRTPVVVSISLIFFSFVIYFVDKKYGGEKTEKNFNLKHAIVAGLFQSIAIIPGASRSGMTIISLLILGYTRDSAAKISFFMAMPIILGAGVFEARKLVFSDINIYLLSGFFSSFLSGLFSISFLLSYLKKKNLSIFVFYRIALGLIVLVRYIVF